MMGNVAIARGAIEAGVDVAASYPGTPASEIMDSLSQAAPKLGMYAEWSANEKVAFEVAFAAALSGLRAIMTCKHLGVNWISDTLLVSAYSGVNGGLTVVTADDPHPFSSQNAEDTRYYSKLAKIPCYEPATPQEAKDIIPMAFNASELLQLPVMVRVTPRISHTKSNITLGPLPPRERKARFEKDVKRYVMIASYARERHPWLNRQYAKSAELAETFPLNKLELVKGAKVGIIACGLSYGYAKEAVRMLDVEGEVSILKLATTNPIPPNLVTSLLKNVEKCLVLEEIEPITETDVKALAQALRLNVQIFGRLTGDIPLEGELTPDRAALALAKVIGKSANPVVKTVTLPDIEAMLVKRTPALCAGCPHRASYYAIKQALKRVGRGGIITGDRGCYNQGVHPPLRGFDTCICMGASIGMACGFYRAGVQEPVVAVIGDSTFFHAGLPALVNAVFNQADITIVILDNGWTSMTGHQPSPATGVTAMGAPTKALKAEDVAKACGVDFIRVVDSMNLEELINAIVEAIKFEGPSVVVSRHPCAIQELRQAKSKGVRIVPYSVDAEKCTGCKNCVSQLGCPAMSFIEGKASIDPFSCTGCGVCAKVCPVKAIEREVIKI
jgi:indolepyruvate ferredoxin oxidoreductase alpha subunit